MFNLVLKKLILPFEVRQNCLKKNGLLAPKWYGFQSAILWQFLMNALMHICKVMYLKIFIIEMFDV